MLTIICLLFNFHLISTNPSSFKFDTKNKKYLKITLAFFYI